jgi:hypothetical protein
MNHDENTSKFHTFYVLHDANETDIYLLNES